MTVPSIRSGFPVVVTSAAATPPYNNLTAAFSANAGDELLAIAIGAGLPTVVSRNSGDTAAGTLIWHRRFVTRCDYTDTTYNAMGALQVAFYTAIVPSGGVTERALYVTNTIANDGGNSVTGTVPARLMVIACDNTNGIGAVAWKGSMKTGSGGSNDITTGLAATQTIKPFGDSSLIIGAGWFKDGTAPTVVGGGTEVVAPGTDRMPLYTRVGTTPGTDVTLGSSHTDGVMWALGLIEFLPTTQPKPALKLFCFGDSGVESTNSNLQTAVKIQNDLAPHWEVFNQGVWWAHITQTKTRWDAEKATYPDFDAAIVQVGPNDLSDTGTWTGTMETNLQSIYTDLETLGVPTITFTVFGSLSSGAPAHYLAFRDWVIANTPSPGLPYNYEALLDPGTGYLTLLAAYNSSDGGHVDGAGNAILGAQLSAWIETLGLVQTARPDADITDGAWTPSTGTDLFAVIDETTASDADYITVTSNSECEIGLAVVDDPDTGTQTFTYRAAGAANKALVAGVYEGATLVQEWTVDPLPAAVTEYIRTLSTGVTDGSDLRIRFETVNAASPPSPTITFGAIGTGANGSTTVAVPVPTGIVAKHYLTIHLTSGATNSETPSTPSGWTLLATGASTDGTFGVDAGPRRSTVFGKVAVGGETTVTVTITNGNTCRGTMIRWTKSQASYAWDVVGQGANDSTSGTGVSMTTAAINWAVGDAALVATGQRVDSATQSSQSLTASGTTFGTRTNRAATAVTTGNDHRHSVDTFDAVTTGGGSAATTWAYTASAAVSAGGVVVRLREVPPTEFARVTYAAVTVPAAPAGGGVTLLLPVLGSTSSLPVPTVSPGAITLVAPVLGSVSSLPVPVVSAGAVTLSPPVLASTSSLPVPTVSPGAITLVAPALGSVSSLPVPVVSAGAVTLLPPVLASTSSLPAPVVDVAGVTTLLPPVLASTSSLPVPTVSPGAITLVAPALGSVSSLPVPVVSAGAVTLLPPVLASTSSLPAPVVDVAGVTTLLPPVLASTSSLPVPTVSPGAITLVAPALGSVSSLPVPVVSAGAVTLNPPVLASTSSLPAPVVDVAGVTTLLPPVLASTSSLPVPTVSPGAITLVAPALGSVSSLPVPVVSAGAVTLNPPVLASTSSLPAPVVDVAGVTTLLPPVLASTSSLPVPTVSPGAITLVAPALGSVSSLPVPVVSAGAVTLLPPVLASTSSLPVPTVSLGAVTLSPPPLGSTSTLPLPVVAGGGSQALAPPVLGSTSSLPVPTVSPGAITLVAPTLGSVSSLPVPTVTTNVTLVVPVLASTSTLPVPTVLAELTLSPPVLGSTSTIPLPTVAGGGAWSISPPVLGSTSSLPVPTVSPGAITLVAPVLGSVSSLPVPAVEAGALGLLPPVLGSTSTLPLPVIAGGPITVYPPVLGSSSNLPIPVVAPGGVPGVTELRTWTREGAERLFLRVYYERSITIDGTDRTYTVVP